LAVEKLDFRLPQTGIVGNPFGPGAEYISDEIGYGYLSRDASFPGFHFSRAIILCMAAGTRDCKKSSV
jgi:hypothetical protein